MQSKLAALSEAGDTWFVCKYCGRGYKEAKNLIAHKRANHMKELIERKRKLQMEQAAANAASSGIIPKINIQPSSSEKKFKPNEPTSSRNIPNLTRLLDRNLKGRAVEDELSFETPVIVKVETRSPGKDSAPSPTSDENNVQNGSNNGSNRGLIMECPLCNAEFQSMDELYEHQVVHGRKYSCTSCTMTYDRFTLLSAHIREAHENENMDSSELISSPKIESQDLQIKIRNVFKCTICSMQFQNSFALNNHLLTHQSQFRYVNQEQTQVQYQHQPRNKVRKCKYCPFQTLHLSSINRHVRATHTAQHEFQCRLCSASFQRKCNLYNHISSVHRSSNQIVARINKKYNLTSTPKPPPKSIYERETSGYSISATAGTLDLKCPYCPRISRDSSQLKIHIRVHTKDKPYVCDYCPHRSSQSGAMNLHIKTVHLAQNPFKCKFCSASFLKRQNLQKHIECDHGMDPDQYQDDEGDYAAEDDYAGEEDYAGEDDYAGEHDYAGEEDYPEEADYQNEADYPDESNFDTNEYQDEEQFDNNESELNNEQDEYESNVNEEFASALGLTKTRPAIRQCRYCPYRSPNESGIRSHEKFAHSTNHPHKCKLCPASYLRLQNLQCHMKKLHPDKPVPGNFTYLTAQTAPPPLIPRRSVSEINRTYGNGSFINPNKNMTMPVLKHQSLQSSGTGFAKAGTSSNSIPRTSLVYKCKICSLEFKERDQLLEHLKTHPSLKAYLCKYCNFRSRDRDIVKQHIQSLHKPQKHDGGNNDACNNSSLTQNSGNQDQEQEDEDDEDGQNYPNQDMLVPQVELKSGFPGVSMSPSASSKDQLYVCPICKKEFRQKSYLESHLMVHSSVRAFSCELCERSYIRKGELIRHLKSKTHSSALELYEITNGSAY